MNPDNATVPPVTNTRHKGIENKSNTQQGPNSLHTKIASVRAHLEAGKSITPLEALDYYGAYRLSSIIFVLRGRGLHIKTEKINNRQTKSRFARYSLIQEI